MHSQSFAAEICPVCGVNRVNGVFLWSHRKPDGTRYEATPDEVFTKVCSRAKVPNKNECINRTGTRDESKDFLALDPSSIQI